MLTSLLKFMGFPAAKPLHSRAEEQPVAVVSRTKTTAAKALVTPKASMQLDEKPARRSSVKTSVVKPKVKATPDIAPARSAKPVAKPKTVPVAPVQASPKAKAVSPVSKPKEKTASVTTVVKTKPPAKPAIPTKPAKVETPVVAVVTAKPAPVVASPQLTTLGVPVRSGRPSSRLAQLTVPSMAQTVASTAAKSSFTQIVTTQPIVSPLASSVKKDLKLANNWKKKAVAELTNEEVIAMSEHDYMNDTQMAFFRLKLVILKNDILSSAGETTEHLREDTVVVPDPADRATIEEEHALELRTRDRERKLLKKIDQAINRIDAGDYGYCDETGEPIGVGRLLARPTATLSLEAQQRRELKQKMFGD